MVCVNNIKLLPCICFKCHNAVLYIIQSDQVMFRSLSLFISSPFDSDFFFMSPLRFISLINVYISL